MSITYDIMELGKALGIGRTTVHKLRREGKLLDPLAFSPPNHPRWSVEEVRRWIEAGTPDAAAWRKLNAGKHPLPAATT